MPGTLMVAAVSVFVLTGAAVQASPASVRAVPVSVPGTSCTVFPSNNVWNMDVSKLPVSAKSKMWKRSADAGTTLLHPDFGPPDYGIPYDVVNGATHSFTSVKFQYKSESDLGPYPFDGSTTVEGGSDRHALMVDSSDCTLYELFHASWNGGVPTAGSGAIFDLTSNALRPAGWTSADAAGLPLFPGLVRWDEVQAGHIDHAIRFTVDCSTTSYIWPARHQAGVSDRRCPPMGARFRLRGGFDLTGFSTDARVVLRAMQHYGMIIADNGSDWYFQGTVDPAWTSGLLDELKTVHAKAFVAVNESGCKVSSDSGAFAYGPSCPAP
ncbi:MAG: hypothetical protein ABI828_07220 [Actinomycetota bacterium]